jgi:hypothetical protein
MKTQKAGGAELDKNMEEAMNKAMEGVMKNPMQKGGAKSKKTKKTKKSKMPSGMAYCLRCQKRVKVNSSEMKMIKMKSGKSRKFKVMQCDCGHEVKNFSS